MKTIPIWKCRRSIIALFSIACLTALGIINKMEVSGAIATIVMAVAAANAGQGIFKKNDDTDTK